MCHGFYIERFIERFLDSLECSVRFSVSVSRVQMKTNPEAARQDLSVSRLATLRLGCECVFVGVFMCVSVFVYFHLSMCASVSMCVR